MNDLSPTKTSVSIIGAGIAGLSCATRLQALGFQVQVYEKSRGPSGRMSTRNGDGWSADHGAQYFTARDPIFIEELNTWITADVASPWSPYLKVFQNNQWQDSSSKENRYVGIPAMNSPGKHLAKNVALECNQTIDRINRQNGKWLLHSLETGDIQRQSDWLILALPAKQAFALTQTANHSIESASSQFIMQGCWTLMAQFSQKPAVDFDAAFINNEIISWICRNNSKPDRSGYESWTIHANAEWSQQKIELDQDEVIRLILECAMKLGLDCRNAAISTHRWRYASGSIKSTPGFKLHTDIRLGQCGDWLNGGRVEGAWLSGYKLASQICEEK